MTTPEQRRQHWEEALRAWNGAQDALDGALARYVEPDPDAGLSNAVLRQHVWDALAQVRDEALSRVARALECDEEAPQP